MIANEKSVLNFARKIKDLEVLNPSDVIFARMLACLSLDQFASGLSDPAYQKQYQIILSADVEEGYIKKVLDGKMETANTALIQATIDFLTKKMQKNIVLEINGQPNISSIHKIPSAEEITLSIQNESDHFFLNESKDTLGDGYCFFHAIAARLAEQESGFLLQITKDAMNQEDSFLSNGDIEGRIQLPIVLLKQMEQEEEYKGKHIDIAAIAKELAVVRELSEKAEKMRTSGASSLPELSEAIQAAIADMPILHRYVPFSLDKSWNDYVDHLLGLYQKKEEGYGISSHDTPPNKSDKKEQKNQEKEEGVFSTTSGAWGAKKNNSTNPFLFNNDPYVSEKLKNDIFNQSETGSASAYDAREKLCDLYKNIEDVIEKHTAHCSFVAQPSFQKLEHRLSQSINNLSAILNQIQSRELEQVQQYALAGGSESNLQVFQKTTGKRDMKTKNRESLLKDSVMLLNSSVLKAYTTVCDIKDDIDTYKDELGVSVDLSELYDAYSEAHDCLRDIFNNAKHIRSEFNPATVMMDRTYSVVCKFVEKCHSFHSYLIKCQEAHRYKQEQYKTAESAVRMHTVAHVEDMHLLADQEGVKLDFRTLDQPSHYISNLKSLKSDLERALIRKSVQHSVQNLSKIARARPKFLEDFANTLGEIVCNTFRKTSEAVWKVEEYPFLKYRKWRGKSLQHKDHHDTYRFFGVRAVSYVIPAVLGVSASLCAAVFATIVMPVIYAGSEINKMMHSHKDSDSSKPLLP